MRPAVQLRVVRDDGPAPAPEGRRSDRGDLSLVTGLFLLNAIPVAGELAGIGRWSPAVVGFAAGALLLTGHELWAQLRALAAPRGPR